MNKLCENHEPVIITSRGEDEFIFLLRGPATPSACSALSLALTALAEKKKIYYRPTDLLPIGLVGLPAPFAMSCAKAHRR